MRTLNASLFSVLLSLLVGGAVFIVFSPQGQWVHYPLHAFIEGLGTFIALLIAVLILMLRIYERLPVRYVWIISALIGMGIFDGFHAITEDPQSFIWLHSLAMLSGGLIFSFVWLPDAIAKQQYEGHLPLKIFVIAIIISLLSLIFSSSIPSMFQDSAFSLLATVINLAAGVLFLIATAYFVLQHKLSKIRDNSIFASHCLLFGVSGFLFAFSAPWDGVWWYWHVLRFAAYMLVLYYFFMLSHAEERQLQLLNMELEDRVARRTEQLRNELKERERVEKELKHLATHDPLTGLYNRNELERRIAEDIDRANRYVHPLSIFMVDIDHFKAINDQYGHAGGDRVLRSVAFELERSLRKTDYVARFGGEEFLVVLPETSLSRAIDLGERMLKRVAKHEAKLGDERVALTISIGVASFPDTATNWSDLLNAADLAMYQAKHDGRNCLRSAKVTSPKQNA